MNQEDSFEVLEESDLKNIDTDNKSNGIEIEKGARYSPRQLYAATTHYLEQVEKGCKRIPGEEQQYETFIKTEGAKDSIVVPPCTDTPEYPGFLITNKSGSPYSITDALKAGKATSSNDKDYIISVKVGQSRPMFKIFGFEFGPNRNHWTHLRVESQGNKIKATHTDSKGFLGRLYSLDHIKKAVQDVFGSEAEFDSKYTGRQGVFDDKNCGRFVAAYKQAVLRPELA